MLWRMQWQSDDVSPTLVKIVGHLANYVDALFPSFRMAQERYRPPTRRCKHWKKFCSVPLPQLADKTPRLTFRNIWPDI